MAPVDLGPCLALLGAAAGSRGLRRGQRGLARGAGSDGPSAEDVRRTTIQPLIRSSPQSGPASSSRQPLQILVLGEANICRSPIAMAMLQKELDGHGLGKLVGCSSKAVTDFSKGEGLPPRVREECELAGFPEVPGDHVARMWVPEWDVCDFDLLVAVDRYVAADAMKEVSIYDTVQKQVEYCGKIRGLYEFGELAQEIEDPLYGNVGGDQERHALRRALKSLESATKGLAESLATSIADASGGALPEADSDTTKRILQAGVNSMLERMGAFDWDAPPMLRRRGEYGDERISDSLLTLPEEV